MFRRSTSLLATEFSEAKTAGIPKLKYKYGKGFGWDTRARRFFLRAIRLETTEANRLVNFKDKNPLVKAAISSIDEDKTKEANPNFVLEDIRVDDFRRISFNCLKCGQDYVRSMKGRMHYQKGCPNRCDEEHHDSNVVPSSVPRLKNVRSGEVLERLQLYNAEKGSKDLMGETPISHDQYFNFKCVDCDKSFGASIRSACAYTPPGQPHLSFVDGSSNNTSVPTSSMMAEVHHRCPTCKHQLAMNRARKQMGSDVETGKKGFYGGLSF